MNVHDFLLLVGSVFKPLHQQIHLGRQHVYLLELMHTSNSLADLKMFFIPTLVGGYFFMRVVA
jgi:hypothetical protein